MMTFLFPDQFFDHHIQVTEYVSGTFPDWVNGVELYEICWNLSDSVKKSMNLKTFSIQDIYFLAPAH